MITRLQGNRMGNFAAAHQTAAKIKPQSSNPNFTGNYGKQMKELMSQKKWLNVMEKMKWFDGEQGRILLTALGTGAIAPLFIAWNPYVKPKEGASEEEKENLKKTQKYTAMRQPISAVLQIIFQLSILTPLNKGLDSIFNNPKNAKNVWVELDKSALQDKKYIERIEKKKLQNEIKEGTVKISDKEKFNEELAKRVKETENKQLKAVTEKLKATGQIHIGERIIDNKVVGEIVNNKIDDYINAAKELQVDSKGMDFYQKRAKDLINNENSLKDIFKNLPENDKEIMNYLKGKLKDSNSETQNLLNEIIRLPEDMRRSRCERTLERINVIKNICNGEFTPAKYIEAMRNDYDKIADIINNLEACKIKDITKTDKETIKETLKKVAEFCHYDNKNPQMKRIFHDSTTFESNASKLLNKVFEDVTKSYKNVVGKKYRMFKEFAGITIGLFITTPITCTALNWVYPRFMEIFFPKLAGNKKPQEPVNGGEK